MKIAGETPGVNFCIHKIERPGGRVLQIRLEALPFGSDKRHLEELPDAVVPMKFAQGKRGAAMRDASGEPIKYADRQDPKFQAAQQRVLALRGTLVVVEGLRGDKTVQFDAQRKDFPTTAAWLEALAGELLDAGIGDGEMFEIGMKIQALGAGHVERINQESEGFLSATPSESAGGSQKKPDDPNDT